MHISKYEILVFTLVGLTSHTVLRTGFLDISLAQYHKNTFSEPFTVTCSRCDDCQMSRFPLLLPRSLLPFLVRWEDVSLAELAVLPGGNCIKIGLPGKWILGYYVFSREYDFSLTENQFSGKTYFHIIHPCLGLDPLQQKLAATMLE